VGFNGTQMSQDPAESNQYLYERIYLELREEIRSGKYRKGDWFPPERVLKDRFATTHLTVRNALAKLVLEGYIERYSGKGTLVIYSRDNAVASQRGSHFVSGHLLLRHMDETNATILETLERQLRGLDLPLRISLHHDDALLEAALYGQAAGSGSLVILEPAASSQSILHKAAELQNTIVVRGLQDPPRCPQVIVDDVKGAREAVRYICDLGYRMISFVSGEPCFAAEQLRKGYEEGLAAEGLKLNVALQAGAAAGVDAAAESCRKILDKSPDCRAFLCATDEAAAGVMRCMSSAGFVPGRDCSVIGYGNSRLASGMGITSLDPGAEKIAETIMSIVRDMMARGSFPIETFKTSPDLKLRTTCSRNISPM